MLLVSTIAPARTLCLPPTVEKNSPYRYLASLAAGLVHAKEGLESVNDPDADPYALIVALRLQQSSFRCAESQVAPYETSSDSTISESAQATAAIFQQLAELDDKFVAHAKILLEATSQPTGEMAEQLAQDQMDLEDTWKLLVHAVILSTYSVVRADPTTGRMSGLALTTSQRDEILETLRSGFGPRVAQGIKGGQHAVLASAAALYQVVGDPKRHLQSR